MTEPPPTEAHAQEPDYSKMTASEAALLIKLDAIGEQLKGISDTLVADHEWKHRVTDFLVTLSKSLEGILRKRGGDDEAEADELRQKRIALLPPYTDEDEEKTQPGAA